MKQQKNILAVGSIALDTIETEHLVGKEILGGSSLYFAVAASNYAPVSLIGVVGEDYPQSGWDIFKSRNIDITNIQVNPGKTFQWGGRYNRDFSERETLFTELGVFKNFSPKICKDITSGTFLYLGNIQPELQLEVADIVPTAKIIICDTMNLWISTSPEKLWEMVKRVDIFLLNNEEAVQMTGESDLGLAAEKLLASGPKTVIIKRGGKGALISCKNESIHVPIFRVDKVVDPTGAGDSFAGGFIGHLAKYGSDDLIEAVITGAAMASFTVSGFGVEGLLKANPKNVHQRRKNIKQLMN